MKIETNISVADILTFFVGLSALGWNVYRDLISIGKLKIEFESIQCKNLINFEFIVRNIGQKPVVVQEAVFKYKTNSIGLNEMGASWDEANIVIEPHGFEKIRLLKITTNFYENCEYIDYFCIVDGTGKTWKTNKKETQKFKKALFSCKKNWLDAQTKTTRLSPE